MGPVSNGTNVSMLPYINRLNIELTSIKKISPYPSLPKRGQEGFFDHVQ